jgi:Leucine-rich repeat (LRR) protein
LLSELEEIDLGWNENLSDITALRNPTKLKKIILEECDLTSLDRIQGIELLTELEEIDLNANENLSDITALRNAKKLKKIVLDRSLEGKISNIPKELELKLVYEDEDEDEDDYEDEDEYMDEWYNGQN